MREILFRGKRIDNGEWVEGDFIAPYFISPYKNSELYINGTYVNEKSVDGIVWCQVSLYRIVPSTVGQYTGLTDKNGKKIFDGDIVKRLGDKCVVKWTEEDAKFIIIGSMTKLDFSLFFAENLEVIGNIHDNPELLDK